MASQLMGVVFVGERSSLDIKKIMLGMNGCNQVFFKKNERRTKWEMRWIN